MRLARGLLAALVYRLRPQDADLVARTVCPACQVTPGIPCRTPRGDHHPGVHPERRTP